MAWDQQLLSQPEMVDMKFKASRAPLLLLLALSGQARKQRFLMALL